MCVEVEWRDDLPQWDDDVHGLNELLQMSFCTASDADGFFVVDGLGCRCVADEPWVTAAETAELALACAAAGWPKRARRLIADLKPLAADDGGYWMGWQFAEEVIWPQEQPAWTTAAVMLAADAIEGLTPGSDLLITPLPDDPVRRRGGEIPAF